MIASVLRLELRRSRSLLGWLTATMVLCTLFMTLYYPTMKANQAALDAMIRMWPKEMLAAFNMQGNLTDVGTFFNVYVFTMIWPIVAAIAGILLATRAIAAVTTLLAVATLSRGLAGGAVAAPLLNVGTFPTEGLLVLGTVSIACWLAAVWAFRRRDLLA